LAAAREGDPERPLADAARLSQERFSVTDSARLAVVARDLDDLAAKLAAAAAVIEKSPDSSFSAPGIQYGIGAPASGRIGFLFPGQGAQYVGMGGDLAMHLPRAQQIWDRYGTREFDDVALHRVVFPPPVFTDAERERQRALLTATEWAQPALAVHSLALLDVLSALGLRPDATAGHSLGELIALHTAGVFGADGLLDLARCRGVLIQDAAGRTPGAMVAISADRTQVETMITDLPDVWLANDNGPNQIVLSGHTEAITVATDRFEREGIRTRRLNTATAFHSPVVAAASGPLADFLGGVSVAAPRIPVYGNADAAPYPGEPDRVRERISAQLASPVLFTAMIEKMYAEGVRTFVEVGAGNTLTGLLGRILGDRRHLAVGLDREGQDGITGLHEALGQLAVAGVELDFAALWEDYAPPQEPTRREGARMTVRIDGGNYGRPYPPSGRATSLPPPNLVVPSPEAVEHSVVSNGASSNGADLNPAALSPDTPRPIPSNHGVSRPALPVPTAAVGSPGLSAPAHSTLPTPTPPAPAGSMYAANGVHPAVTDPELLTLIEQTQRQTAQAHADYQRQTTEAYADYQRQVTESHLAYLRMSELSLATLMGNPLPATPQFEPPAAPAPQRAPEPQPEPAVTRPPTELPPATPTPTPMLQAPGLPVAQSYAADIDAETMETVDESAADSLDPAELEQRVLAVVAERTGYPVEILNLDMELVADLGVDSIKRIEILSAFRGQVRELPESDIAEFATARTLREVLSKFRERLEPGSAGATPESAATHVSGSGANQENVVGRRGDHAAATPLLRTVPRAVLAPACGLAMGGLHDGPIVVTDDGTGVAPLVVAALRAHDCVATVTATVPADATGVILLDGLAAVDSAARAAAVQREAFRTAMTASARLATGGGVFVTVQDTGGDFGLAGRQGDRAWLGGLAGLARTAAKEWPKAAVKAIDCERGDREPQALAEAIVSELCFGGPDLDVGLRADGSRHTLRQMPAPSTASVTAGIEPESVIVVTGGARGVTAAAVLALAAEHRPKLVLLGRTPLEPEPAELANCPDEPALIRALAEREPTVIPTELTARGRRVLAVREVRQTLAAIERAGSPVRYLTVDVRDVVALGSALDGVRAEWGPITGVVHGAGVLADAMLVDKTEEQLDRVLGTKIDGLRALLDATAADPLRVLCMFSSVAGVFGNPGQADYAVANEVLAQVASAERARRPDCLVRSIAWGPWRGGMVTAALADLFTEVGVELIPIETGASAFVAELAVGEPEARVCLAMADGPGSIGLGRRAPGPVQIRIDADRHPYLADHAVSGVPVLPVALVAEWFARIAASWLPEPGSVVLRDLRVLRKITLPDLADGGHILAAYSRLHHTGEPSMLEIELRTIGEAAHVRATAAVGVGSTPERWSEPAGLRSPDAMVPYDGWALFHGPRFRSLRSMSGIGAAGAVGELVGVRELGWPGEGWGADPAALDGALQLASLWAMEVLGGRVLPMAVGQCRLWVPGLLTDSARCVVLAGEVGPDHAICDTALIDKHGTVMVELLGVELVRRPD